MLKYLPILHQLEPQLKRYTLAKERQKTCTGVCQHETDCSITLHREYEAVKEERTSLGGVGLMEEDVGGILEVIDVLTCMEGARAVKLMDYLYVLLDNFWFVTSSKDGRPAMDVMTSLIAHSMIVFLRDERYFKVSARLPSERGQGYGDRSTGKADYFLRIDPRKLREKTNTDGTEALGISEFEAENDADYWDLIAFICASYPQLRKLVVCIKK